MKHRRPFRLAMPRGEAALPLLAVALFVMAFVAWPLVDAGVLMRPLLGMTFLITALSGLYMVGLHGRLGIAVVALGTLLVALRLVSLVWTSKLLQQIAQFALGVFLFVLCAALMTAVMAAGRVTPNRIIGAVGIGKSDARGEAGQALEESAIAPIRPEK